MVGGAEDKFRVVVFAGEGKILVIELVDWRLQFHIFDVGTKCRYSRAGESTHGISHLKYL